MLVLMVAVLMVAACGRTPATRVQLEWDFAEGDHGWSGDFTDLPVDYEQDSYQLEFGHWERPQEVGEGKALMIRGMNRSDDLFMFIKRQLTTADGIKPGTSYQLRFVVELATNAPAGAFGVGGPPGEAVWVKVGGAPVEPVPVIIDEAGTPYYVPNVDKGRQNEDGEHAIRIGDVAKVECGEFDVYELKTLSNSDNPITVTADDNGNLWLLVGTDSGFEGMTELYYTSISVDLQPVD